MSLLTEEIAYLREDVKDLQHRLALKDLEIMRLREALNAMRDTFDVGGDVTSEENNALYKADKALSTPATYDDLMAWHEAQLGEPVAWKYKRRDGQVTATVNPDFAMIVKADGFEVTPLYTLKDK